MRFTIDIREMTPQDYDTVYALWEQTEGVGLSAADSRERINSYLERNPGCSFVARDEERAVGAVLCGHDGRRGYLHHLAVKPAYRRHGVGRQLITHALTALRKAGIDKCHLFVFKTNAPALAFWQANGWQIRTDIQLFSKDLSG